MHHIQHRVRWSQNLAPDLTMPQSQVHRTSLRIDRGTYHRIERSRARDGGTLTLNAWLDSAIQEKLGREGLRECPPTYYGAPEHRKHFSFYEFFAGGGMARAGLGNHWNCLFANDFDAMKARTYRQNWNGGSELVLGDINNLGIDDLPVPADMAWASFPCQDLSLAGSYEGIGHWKDEVKTRSGTFWAFLRLMQELHATDKSPRLIVLENVYGILTANQGGDFSAIGSALEALDYRFGAIVLDARHFVPQSRPRVFIVGVRANVDIPERVISDKPLLPWHPPRMVEAYSQLSPASKAAWQWWSLPKPPPRPYDFIDLIEEDPEGVKWHSSNETEKLISMMSDINLAKVAEAQNLGKKTVGGIYKRTRADDQGNKIQRAEVRFDSIAGCLRTPAGGSSRQTILVVDGPQLRSRLLSPREAARLMGLPDSYVLPRNYNDAYHVAGDGVAVPAVRYLSEHIIEPILESQN